MVVGLTIPDFNTYYEATKIKTSVILAEILTNRLIEQNWEWKIDPYLNDLLLFEQSAKVI